MTYIPDCRSDEVYNFNNLNDEDKHHIEGYDYCVENAVDNFFNNLDDIDSDYLKLVLDVEIPENMATHYEIEFSEDHVEEREVKTYADLLRYELLHHLEIERDEIITSMIDSYPEEV